MSNGQAQVQVLLLSFLPDDAATIESLSLINLTPASLVRTNVLILKWVKEK
jgi:hypothetical protein